MLSKDQRSVGMGYWAASFLISLIASLVAIIVALAIERRRLPKLLIEAKPEADAVPDWNDNRDDIRGKVKFCRLAVSNDPFPRPFRWVPRQTAQECRATLDFYTQDSELMFSMSGRWAGTPELAFLSQEQQILRLLTPDPVTIPVDGQEFLDVLIWHDRTKEAYAWNNEAYPTDWKPQHHKLSHGEYKLVVRVATQNGTHSEESFRVKVGPTIGRTKIERLS